MTNETISIEEYENKYKPVFENEQTKQFADFEDAINYVRENITKELEYRYVWSATYGDDDSYFMCNGRHICNVIHYEVCKVAWGTENHEDNGNISIIAEEN